MSKQPSVSNGAAEAHALPAVPTNGGTVPHVAPAADPSAPEHVGPMPPQPDYPRYRVEPGVRVRLPVAPAAAPTSVIEVDPNETEGMERKKDAEDELARQRERIAELQARLYAEQKQSLLIVLQAMDTGGKDGTIKHVFGGVNPQGCQVHSFKQPSAEELAHDFLWRYHQRTPTRGMITIFNRSHYEDVLVVRVKNLVPEEEWQARYDLINQFEQMLTRNGTRVIKFFLYISKDEQKRRLESRLQQPDKRWKFSAADIRERQHWDAYMEAYAAAINRCSTDNAPWYVVPANHKWYRNLVVARTIADTLEAMNPQYPTEEGGLDQIVIPD